MWITAFFALKDGEKSVKTRKKQRKKADYPQTFVFFTKMRKVIHSYTHGNK